MDLKPYTAEQVPDSEKRLTMNVSKLQGYLREWIERRSSRYSIVTVITMGEIIDYLEAILEVSE